MKRKLIALFFAAVCLIGLVSCNEKKTETATGEETYVRYDYDLSRYIYIPQYRNLAITCQDPEVCTDKEIDDALTQVLLSYATFEVHIPTSFAAKCTELQSLQCWLPIFK